VPILYSIIYSKQLEAPHLMLALGSYTVVTEWIESSK
jgi:hypothetical protein